VSCRATDVHHSAESALQIKRLHIPAMRKCHGETFFMYCRKSLIVQETRLACMCGQTWPAASTAMLLSATVLRTACCACFCTEAAFEPHYSRDSLTQETLMIHTISHPGMIVRNNQIVSYENVNLPLWCASADKRAVQHPWSAHQQPTAAAPERPHHQAGKLRPRLQLINS
jgi:hypothetical protein